MLDPASAFHIKSDSEFYRETKMIKATDNLYRIVNTCAYGDVPANESFVDGILGKKEDVAAIVKVINERLSTDINGRIWKVVPVSYKLKGSENGF